MNRPKNRSLSPVTGVLTELQQMLTPNQFDQVFVSSNRNSATYFTFLRQKIPVFMFFVFSYSH